MFDELLLHGSNIHTITHDFGTFPATMASALSDYRFITKLCQLGLDVSKLFECPYGNHHPPYEELRKCFENFVLIYY